MPKSTLFNLPEKKRKRITKTLVKHFAHKPYSEVDIEDIAQESNVSKGSMYQYFENKRDMYFYAITETLNKYLKVIEKIDFKSMSFFDYIKRGFEFYWKFLLNDRDAYLLMEKTALYNDSPYRKEVEKIYHSKSQEILKKIIIENQKAGFIRGDVNPETIMIFIDGASWNLKKAILKIAQEKGVPIHKLPKEVIESAQNEFLKLLENGIATKK